jgi:hypothetical protein
MPTERFDERIVQYRLTRSSTREPPTHVFEFPLGHRENRTQRRDPPLMMTTCLNQSALFVNQFGASFFVRERKSSCTLLTHSNTQQVEDADCIYLTVQAGFPGPIAQCSLR